MQAPCRQILFYSRS